MYVSDIEQEIAEVIAELQIADRVAVFKGGEKESILAKLQETFVTGNPRVWWLSLRYKPASYVYGQDYQYEDLVKFFKPEEEVWFAVHDDYDEMLLYRTKVSNLIDMLGECFCLEYNIVSLECDRFLCETDHDDILYIDVNQNELKV